MKELFTRILVSLFGIPLLVFCIWRGDIWFLTLFTLIGILGQFELYNLAKAKDISPNTVPGILLLVMLMLITAYGRLSYLPEIALLLLIIIMLSEMFRNKGSALLNTAMTIMGIVYPGGFLASLIYLRIHTTEFFGDGNAAQIYVLSLFISVWACDTFAYFAGITLGKHKLFERVSPKKSIEGAVAGLTGSIAVFLALWWTGLLQFSWIFLLLSGVIVGTVGQLGDLVESWLKRDARVKDASSILPGHGGILDRFDSLILISPAILVWILFWT